MQFGPGFYATFLYYFATTAILFSLVASKALNLSIASGIPQQAGLLAGLFAGVLGGYFNRTATLTVAFKNQKAFLKEVDTALIQRGYRQQEQDDSLWIYERPGMGKFLSGKVFVQIEDGQATIASRALQLRGVKDAIEKVGEG